jgi:hypothetical protein
LSWWPPWSSSACCNRAWAACWPPGRLPGDLRFRLRGREYAFPFGSVIVFSLVAALIGWLL